MCAIARSQRVCVRARVRVHTRVRVCVCAHSQRHTCVQCAHTLPRTQLLGRRMAAWPATMRAVSDAPALCGVRSGVRGCWAPATPTPDVPRARAGPAACPHHAVRPAMPITASPSRHACSGAARCSARRMRAMWRTSVRGHTHQPLRPAAALESTAAEHLVLYAERNSVWSQHRSARPPLHTPTLGCHTP